MELCEPKWQRVSERGRRDLLFAWKTPQTAAVPDLFLWEQHNADLEQNNMK